MTAMIVLAAALACAPKQRSYEYVAGRCHDDVSPTAAVVSPGSPVAFTRVAVPEGLGVPTDWVPRPSSTSAGAFVEVVGSEEDWQRFHTWGSAEFPSFDFDSVNVLVALLGWDAGSHRLEITNVRDTGSGALQVDLTFHRAEVTLQTEGHFFAIATVPRGEYAARANLTMLCYESRPVRR